MKFYNNNKLNEDMITDQIFLYVILQNQLINE